MSKKSIIYLIFVIAWMGFIFYMSNIPGDKSGNKSSEIVSFIIDKYDKITNATEERIAYHHSEEFINKANFIFRKICHFTEYLILSILTLCFLISINKCVFWKSGLYSTLFSIFYACLDEYHQTFINERSGQIGDVLIDSSGIIIGFLLVSGIKKVKKRKLQMEIK